MDQAVGLRKNKDGHWNDRRSEPLVVSSDSSVRVMAVSSGKGGVGKSTVVVNLAVAFDRLGKRVLIMDADLGLSNIDVFLGITPKHNISHVLEGHRSLREVLVDGPGNIRVMPASSGVQKLTQLSDEQKLLLLEILDELESEVDIVLIDTGAGISDTVLYFNMAAQERLIVVTPEPTSLTDAYALIKVLYTRHGERHFKIVVNSVEDEKKGKAVFAKISKVADHFLDGISLDYLGCIPHDLNVSRAIIQQRPFMDVYPHTYAAKAFMLLAQRIQKSPPHVNHGTVQFFWKRLLRA